jgi:hypothetical protein
MPKILGLKTRYAGQDAAAEWQKPAVFTLFQINFAAVCGSPLLQLVTTKLTLILTWTDPQLFLKLLAQI